MHDRPVAHGHPVADSAWEARVCVEHRAVLDVGVATYSYHLVVGAQDGAVPDARAGPEAHLPDHRSGGRHPGVLVYHGRTRLDGGHESVWRGTVHVRSSRAHRPWNSGASRAKNAAIACLWSSVAESSAKWSSSRSIASP